MTNLISNDSFALNITNALISTVNNTAFNYTNVEPIESSYQVQYSFLQQQASSFINMDKLNSSTKLELRKLCWETMFGQELVKLTVMDLVRNIECSKIKLKQSIFKFSSAPNSHANSSLRFLSRTFRSLYELVLVLGFRKTFS